jgi:integrase
VLALGGLRWSELAGLKVGDRIPVPGRLRLQRTVTSSNDKGDLYEDTLKNKRAHTVPLVADLGPVLDKWSAGKAPGAWLIDQNLWDAASGSGACRGHPSRTTTPRAGGSQAMNGPSWVGKHTGGRKGIRTPDIFLVREALYR